MSLSGMYSRLMGDSVNLEEVVSSREKEKFLRNMNPAVVPIRKTSTGVASKDELFNRGVLLG